MSLAQFPALIIAKEVAFPSAGVRTTALTDGQIAFFDVATNLSVVAAGTVDGGGNAQDLFIAQYTGDPKTGTNKTYPMLAKNIKQVYKKAYTAPVNQVSYFGFDGTDTEKTLSFLCETDYSLGIRLESEEINNYFGNAGLFRFVQITTACCEDCTAGCTPIDCKQPTADLVRHFNADNFLNQSTNGSTVPASYASAVMVTDGTFTANNGTGFSMTVVNRSTAVTTSGAHGLSAGAYVRIGGTGNTVAVYKVAAVPTTTTLTLDTPFQGASATVAAANWGPMTASTVCGIQVTGGYYNPSNGCSCEALFIRRKPTIFKLSPGTGWDCLVDVDLDGTYDGFITYTTDAVIGNGSGAEIAELENELLGYTYKRETFGYDPRWQLGINRFAVAATNYDMYYIRFEHKFESGTIFGTRSDIHYTIVAVPQGGSLSTALTTLLNTWIVAEPISLPTI